MEGFVDVRFFLNDRNGRRTVNGEAIIEVPGRSKKVNDKRYGDVIITANYWFWYISRFSRGC